MTERRAIPAPVINPENRPYFDACAQGRLLIKRCRDCREAHFYPRTLCPHCFGSRTDWQQATGTGTVYTFSVMRQPIPFVVAYVTLDEGPTMLSNIVDCDPGLVRIGARVRAVFRKTEGEIVVPMFAPLPAGE